MVYKKVPAGKKLVWERVSRFPQFSILIALLLLLIVFSFVSNSFFTFNNIINVFRQTSTSIIVSIGMTFVFILGGMDLSVGSAACLSGLLAAGLMTGKNGMQPIPVVAAILLALLAGTFIGLINGIIITRIKLPPFIVTLAMMSTVRGIALVYTDGSPISKLPNQALDLGRGYLGAIPIPVIVMAVVLAIAWIVLACTRFGRYIYAIGGNEECTRLSGINVNKIKLIVYSISGLCAAITGILLTMRLGSGQPTLAEGLEMDAITAVVLGGTAITGGRGYMLGTLLGCVFLTFLGNGFNIIGISSFWQQILKGIILIVAISLYSTKKK